MRLLLVMGTMAHVQYLLLHVTSTRTNGRYLSEVYDKKPPLCEMNWCMVPLIAGNIRAASTMYVAMQMQSWLGGVPDPIQVNALTGLLVFSQFRSVIIIIQN